MSAAALHKGNGSARGAAANQKQQQQHKRSIGALMLQALAITQDDGKEWEQDELLDTVYWMRQIFALLCGIIWGGIPLKGLPAFIGFMAVKFGGLFVWFNRAGIDVNDYGGAGTVYNEGLPPSLGLFVLVWVLTFTLLHS